MRRAVKKIEAFEFRGDFAPVPCDSDKTPEKPTEEAEDKISLSGPQLAALLSEARAEGINEALAACDTSDQDKLACVTTRLNEALANLVVLSEVLENMAEENAHAERSLFLIKAAASNITEGQGELFADRKGFQQTVEPSDEIFSPEAEDTL